MTSASTYSESDTGRPTVSGADVGAPGSGRDPDPGPAMRQRGNDSLTSVLHGQRPDGDPVRVIMSQAAQRTIADHCSTSLAVELGGVLLGQARQVGEQLETIVLAALPAEAADHGPIHFTFSAEVWLQIHRDKESTYPNLEIVGWYHTHPDLGVFYSADDVVVHSAAFVLPWHIGLVVDPVRGEAALFGWFPVSVHDRGLELGALAGYHELLDERDFTMVPWKVVTSVVDVTDDPGGVRGHAVNQVYLPASDWLSLPPVSPWWGVLLGSASLLISLLLLLERILSAGE